PKPYPPMKRRCVAIWAGVGLMSRAATPTLKGAGAALPVVGTSNAAHRAASASAAPRIDRERTMVTFFLPWKCPRQGISAPDARIPLSPGPASTGSCSSRDSKTVRMRYKKLVDPLDELDNALEDRINALP